MIGMILSQLRRRRGRALSLALGILVAATGFTLLTSAVTTSRAQTTGIDAAEISWEFFAKHAKP